MSQPLTSLLPRPTSSIVLSSLPIIIAATSPLCLSPQPRTCHVQLAIVPHVSPVQLLLLLLLCFLHCLSCQPRTSLLPRPTSSMCHVQPSTSLLSRLSSLPSAPSSVIQLLVLSSLPVCQPRTQPRPFFYVSAPCAAHVLHCPCLSPVHHCCHLLLCVLILHCPCVCPGLSPVHHCCHVQLLPLSFLHCPCLSPIHHCCHVQLLLLRFLHCPCLSPVHHCRSNNSLVPYTFISGTDDRICPWCLEIVYGN